MEQNTVSARVRDSTDYFYRRLHPSVCATDCTLHYKSVVVCFSLCCGALASRWAKPADIGQANGWARTGQSKGIGEEEDQSHSGQSLSPAPQQAVADG